MPASAAASRRSSAASCASSASAARSCASRTSRRWRARPTTSYRVSKLTDGRTSRTTVSALGADERVEELARMLGGVEVTRKAREHAREMLKAAVAAG